VALERVQGGMVCGRVCGLDEGRVEEWGTRACVVRSVLLLCDVIGIGKVVKEV
jgi:hypothetical protein